MDQPMSQQAEVENFLCSYNLKTSAFALEARKLLLKLLPDLTQQLDGPVRMARLVSLLHFTLAILHLRFL